MSIEIKQLNIHANVEDADAQITSQVKAQREEALKNDILKDCKRLIQDVLSNKGDR